MRVKAFLTSPLILFLIGGTRLLLVSNSNTETAITILRLGGTTDTLLGVLIPLLPLLLPSAFVLCLILRQWPVAAVIGVCTLLVAYMNPSSASLSTWWAITAAGMKWYFVGLLYLPRWGWLRRESWDGIPKAGTLEELVCQQPLLTALLVATIIYAIVTLAASATGGVPERLGGGVVGLIVGLVACAPVATGFLFASSLYPIPPQDSGVWEASFRRFWMPAESIGLASGEKVVGYPLGIKDEWQILLVDRGRSIRYVRPEDIKARSVCGLEAPPRGGPFWGSSDYVPSDYPSCYPSPAKPDRHQLRSEVLTPERARVPEIDPPESTRFEERLNGSSEDETAANRPPRNRRGS